MFANYLDMAYGFHVSVVLLLLLFKLVLYYVPITVN